LIKIIVKYNISENNQPRWLILTKMGWGWAVLTWG